MLVPVALVSCMEFVAIGLPSASKTKSLLNCGPYHELRNASTARHKLVVHAIVQYVQYVSQLSCLSVNCQVWVSAIKFDFEILSLSVQQV